MNKFRIATIAAATIAGAMTLPTAASAETVAIGTPAVACSQGHGAYRVFDHLVIAFEWCTEIDFPIDPPDTMVLLMDESIPNPKSRCDHSGGRFEYLGDPNHFHLHICWGIDY